MATDAARTRNPNPPSLLMAEVQNEPQWIVWPDVEHEAAWAEGELAREWIAAERAAHPTR